MSNALQTAIDTYGARAVYAAAERHMNGDKAALGAVGLSAMNLAQAYEIHTKAHRQMGLAAQAIDLADAQAKLDVLVARLT